MPSPDKTASSNDHPAGADANGLPPSGLRTAITMLILLHLFALLTAVASNVGAVSELRAGLRNVPGLVPYLQVLHMDLGYNYHLTYDQPLDYNHYAQVELDWKGQHDPNARRLELPGSFRQPGIRRQRYFSLNRAIATRAILGQDLNDDNMAALLPRAVFRTLLAENGIDSGTHRFGCRYHMARSPQDVASVNPEESDPNDPRRFGVLYEANLLVDDGEVDIVKVDNAAQTAPVKRVPRPTKDVAKPAKER